MLFRSVLHGPVQGRLAAIAIAIRLHAEKGVVDPADSAATARKCQLLLAGAINDLKAISAGTTSAAGTLGERLEGLRVRWAGMVNVQFNPPSAELGSLVMSALMQDRVVDVVEEAINNACTHGRARHVVVSLAVAERGTVRITVEDDGTGPKAPVRTGMGLGQIQAQGSHWSLESAPTGARLTVDLSPSHHASMA